MSISAICGIDRSPTTSVLPSFVSCRVSGCTPMNTSPASRGWSPETSSTRRRLSLRTETYAVLPSGVTRISLGRVPIPNSQISSPVRASSFETVPGLDGVAPSFVE